MKLLRKSAVDAQAALQRKNQIDEGIALAGKIDALRKTLGDVELQHRNFLAGMEADLKDKLSYLTESIAIKKLELAVMQEHNGNIDVAWRKIVFREAMITDRERRADAKLAKASEELGKIRIRETELDMSYARIEKLREEEEIRNEKARLSDRPKTNETRNLTDTPAEQQDGGADSDGDGAGGLS